MRNLLGALFVLACLANTSLRADGDHQGVSDGEILIGQCAALTGPSAGLGTGMNTGLKAAFEEVNSKGGVGGRKIRLIAHDDGYDPDKCVDCTEEMIEDNGVFALAGYVGTPTAKVAAPVVDELKVPLIGLFTGAALLRQPVQPYIVNIRASYDDETEALTGYLLKTGASKIAVFYQNDSFGLAGLAGMQKALEHRQLNIAAKGLFERNTVAVKAGLADILTAAPDVVVIIAPYKPTAAFVRAAREAGLKARFATISFVGTSNLIAELGAEANGIVISQVVPPPDSSNLEIATAFRSALKSISPKEEPSYVGFEGYITGRVLVAALERAGEDLTRGGLLAAINKMTNVDLGGINVSFSETDHQGLHSVYLSMVKDQKAEPIL